MISRRLLISSCLLPLLISVHVSVAQTRDHLTTEEQQLVRDAQILDKRIDIFIKAADRRLLAIRGGSDPSTAKQLKKDSEKWGELPTGSRAELVRDIAKILDESITNIDDVSAHDEKNPLIAKSLRKLATETTRIVEQLKPLQSQAKGEAEIGSFEELIDNAESIVQAAAKLPPPVDKKSKSKKDEGKTTN